MSVADDGTETKSESAGRLYDQLILMVTALQSSFPGAPAFAKGPDTAKAMQAQAALANAVSAWFFTEVTAHVNAKVGAAVAALQKTPNPNNPATLTAASGSDVLLPLV